MNFWAHFIKIFMSFVSAFVITATVFLIGTFILAVFKPNEVQQAIEIMKQFRIVNKIFI